VNIETLVRHSIAPIVGIASYFLAPEVDGKHPAAELSTFFATSATVLGAFFIALAVLSLLSPLANLRIREIVGHITLVYLAIGTIVATAGSASSWPDLLYRYLFAMTVGTGIATVVAITRLGIANMDTQRDQLHSALAQLLGASKGEQGKPVAPTEESAKPAAADDTAKGSAAH
jgi:hypothetical protein